MDSAILFGNVTVYYTTSHISSLRFILCNTLNIEEGFVQIYQMHISVTIPVLLSHSFFNIYHHFPHPPLILFLPPAAALLLYICAVCALSSPSQTHTHTLCVAPLASGYISSWISLSLSAPQAKSSKVAKLPQSLPLELSHYLTVIFQIWPLIGFLLRLSQ